MPQFRKIDGVLAGELQGNPDDLSSAMIAINQAVDQNLSDAILMGAMQNPMAKLSNIQSQHAEKYRMVMAAEKRQKNEREGNGNIVLQHDEIQELINSMNRLMALQTIEDMVRNKNENGLLEALDLLKPEVGTVPRTRLANSVLMNELTSILQKNGMLRLQDVEASLKTATMKGESSKSSINPGNANNIHSVVQKINCSLENGEITELLGLLKSPCLKLEQHVLSFAGSLYFAELDYIRRGSGTNLSAEGIIRVCIFLSTVAKINEAAESRNYEKVFHLASEEGANLEDLQESMKTRYGEAMKTALIAKQKLSVSNLKRAECGIACKLLNHADIQDCIDMVNSEEVDSDKIEAVKLVNDAVRNLDHKQLFRALQNPTLELEKNVELKKYSMNSIKKETTGNPDQIQKGNLICEEDSLHYLCLLRDIQRDRSLLVERQNAGNSIRGNGTNDGNLSELWMEDILEAVEYGLNDVYEAKSASFNLSILNMAVMQKNSGQTYDMLRKEDLDLKHNEFRIYEESKLKYLEELNKVLSGKEESGANGVWVEHKLTNNNGKVIIAYLNLRDQKHSWRKPRDYNGPRMSGYLGQDEILTILNNVNSNCTHNPSLPPNWDARVWTQFQARCRGNLVRHKIFTMLRHYYDNEQKIVKIQAYWKGRSQRQKYHQILLEKVSLITKSSRLATNF
jgi:Ras GTPase-activating-like protein IQGAP2/3